MGCPSGEESTDERWRPAGEGAVQVDGRYTPERDGGRNDLVQIEREVASTGERWRATGDRYRGREKRNE